MQPLIAVTPGEPAGIGPDICLQLAEQEHNCRLVHFADPELMQQRADLLGSSVNITTLESLDDARSHHPGQLQVYPVLLKKTTIAGQLDPANANYVLECLSRVVDAINRHSVDALVTGPVHKGIINQAGISFTGHTEFLAGLTHAHPVMMLATESLRVALATTHLPLSQVSQAITQDSLTRVIEILHQDLVSHFSINKPRILVCGLNPHAGEDGHLGREEIDVITPVLETLRTRGMDLIGPLPADTLFTPHYLQQADAVLAMYHDQGLPVLKHVGFGHAVNITLGLPIIRTSVDHGTALELSGTGKANSGSLQTAIDLAIQLSMNKLSV
ncbi:MAG: 4-hydroxythreonine-4-phosphate dehydrogenase PdxA [Gammaproteobacteria bacterium]